MGCGASSAAPGYVRLPGEVGAPEDTWTRVCQTLDSSKGQQKSRKLVVKRSGWKTVRIFVSSTFKDLHHEREMLVKEVFPDLRAWCENRRLHLVDVDLRWGIPKDTSSEDTLRSCLGEIDRCYQDNVMPFFLNMTSERVGWIPLEDEVPGSLVEQYRWVFGLSVTEMEIVHGAYRKDNPNSIFMLRDDSFLREMPDDQKKLFVDENIIAPQKIATLRKMIADRFPAERVLEYHCTFQGEDESGNAVLNVSNTFKEKIFEFFKMRIKEQYPLPDANIDPYQHMKESHEAFMKNRAENVLGRDKMLEDIKTYVETGGSDVPLLILGDPGQGKSSLMAKTADICDTLTRSSAFEKWHVFYHFVGAVPGSTDLEDGLRRLLKELKIVNDNTMPKDLSEASQLCWSVLSNPRTKPVIIIMDAMNQLDDDLEAQNASWIPRKLSPSVRCIFSMIPNTPPHKALMGREPKPKELFVRPLGLVDRKNIVVTVLGEFNKTLDTNQIMFLLDKPASENPLWLSIAIEELRVYGSFRKLTEKIQSLADGLLEILAQVLDRFETEAGGDLVIATLCLIEVSNRGLLESELLQILADEDNLMPPSPGDEKDEKESTEKGQNTVKSSRLAAFKWSSIYRALRTFLRPYGDSGDGRLDFYHRSLSKAVRKKYFGEGSNQTSSEEAQARYLWWHKKLADFFMTTDNIERKVEELPFHLVKLDDKDRLADILCEWRVFEDLYNEEFSSNLLKYWNYVGGSEVKGRIFKSYNEEVLNMENSDVPDSQRCFRYMKYSGFFNQSGLYDEAKDLANKAKKLEESTLGNRKEQMAKLEELLFKILDEKVKLNEFIYMSQKPAQWEVLAHGLKCVEIRKSLSGDSNKIAMAIMMMKSSFTMNTWITLGGSAELSLHDTKEMSMDYINTAIETFREAHDLGHLAEAIMTKAILSPNMSTEQRKLYEEAYELTLQVYGEYSVLAARCQINTGIHYEELGKYRESYRYFKRYSELTEEVFGPAHPKAIRGKNILSEPMYARIGNEIAAENTNNIGT